MPRQRKRTSIGILTAGGDCPGLNAVIRAVAKTAMSKYEARVFGFEDGYFGLVTGRYRELFNADVSNILTLGGTILGTDNRHDPFAMSTDGGPVKDFSPRALKVQKKLGLKGIVCIGGDGTLTGAHRFSKIGLPVVGVPKTIDNDLYGTDRTFGFDSAVQTVAEAIDKLHTTAASHHRVMVVEVMGRHAGWIALHGGTSAGGDVILMPEIPYRLDRVCEYLEERSKVGKRFSIVVVAEGAKPAGGKLVYKDRGPDGLKRRRLGGIGHELGEDIREATGREVRVTVLGHLQRGGTPTAMDRVLGTAFGHRACELVMAGDFNKMVALRGTRIVDVPLSTAARGQRKVPRSHYLIAAARAVGTCFGD